MSAQAANLPFLQTLLKCRIDKIKQHEGRFFHNVTCPAPDAYSQPSSFAVTSDSQFAAPGEEVTIQVAVSGFLKPFGYTKDGIQQKGERPNVFLNFVRHVQTTENKG